MPSGADDIDRLRAAIDAHERFVAEHGRRSVAEFLADHEPLRDLLEPLLGQGRPASQPHAPNERVLGDFRLLGEIGRGGMGVVYEAEQISLGRRVAVKVLPGRLALDPDRRARFERESRLAASLDHPGIAKVISADADGDVIWFAMERVDGAPLDRVLERTADTQVARLTGGLFESAVGAVAGDHEVASEHPEAAPDRSESTVWRRGYVDTVVRIGAQVAEALHHAHQHGVIHRDVKPGNVLLRRDGRAVLTDFGLARELDAPSLSVTGDFLGTPSYSAPEQLSGTRAAVDARTDVFALGVTLYELLTHRRPFEASSAEEVRTRILSVEPPRPRRLNPKIPADLSAVLLKALEKDPGQRYQSAADMAQDLRAVAAGRPVKAVPVPVHRRAWRWCRRNRWATIALAALSGVVGLLLTVRTQLVHSNADQARSALRSGLALARADDFHGALDGLMTLEQQFPGASSRAALEELFRRHPCLASYPLTGEPDERVICGSFSFDGRWLATVHMKASGPERGFQMRIWRAPSPAEPATPMSCEWERSFEWESEREAIRSGPTFVGPGPTVLWLQSDRTVAVGGPGRVTSLIELTEPVMRRYQTNVEGCFGAWLGDRVQVRDEAGAVQREWAAVEAPSTICFVLDDILVRMDRKDPGSPWIVTPTGPGAPSLGHGAGNAQIQTDPRDPTRIVITTETWITAWRAVDGELKPDGRRENRLPISVTRSLLDSDEPELESVEAGFAGLGGLSMWRSNLVAARFFAAGGGRPREPYIVAIEDRALRIWGSPEPYDLDAQQKGLEIAAFEGTGQQLWGAGVETLSAWEFDVEGVGARLDVEMPREIRDAVQAGMVPSFCGMAFDPGRSVLLCARADAQRLRSPGWIFVLPADRLQPARSYPCRSEPSWIALSPDRRQLAVAERDGGVELWAYDQELRELTGCVALPALAAGAKRLSCARYLGTRFLLASQGDSTLGGGILRWDLDHLDAPPVPLTPPGVHLPLRCLAVSPDDQLVATGGDDRFLRVLRVVQSSKPDLVPSWHADHGAGVFAVAFAEREDTLVLASADQSGEIRLWDARTGAAGGLVRDASENASDQVLSLDFSPDGRHLAASLQGGHVLLWDMDRPGRCLEGNRECAVRLLRLQAASD